MRHTKEIMDVLLDLLVDIENGSVLLSHFETEQETIDIQSYGRIEQIPIRNQILKLYISRRN
jgi:hypothetical protein